MLLAVINGIRRIANGGTRVALGVFRIGHNGLSRHRKGAKVLGQNIVIILSTGLELVRDGVIARANRSLGASRMNPAVAGEVRPDEAGVNAVRAHVDPIFGKGRTVVDLGSACRGQLNVTLINSEGLSGVLVAAVVISGGANLDRHRTSINRRNHRRVAAPFGVKRALNAVLKAHINAGNRRARACRTSGVRLGVVSVFNVVGRDGKTVFRGQRSDGELALVLSDIVVVRLEVGTLVVSDGVGNLALGDRGHRAGSANVNDLAVDKAVARHSDIRPGKSSAIVRLGICHASEDHRALEDLVGHVDTAGVVALTGNGHGNGTDIGGVLAVRKRVVNTLCQSLLAVLDDRLLLLGLTVIFDVFGSLHRHVLAGLDALGRDGDITIGYLERDLGEVVALVHEVARRKAHISSAFIRTFRFCLAFSGEIKVAGSVFIVGDTYYLITLNALRLAIVFLCVVFALNRNDNLVFIRRNGKRTRHKLDSIILSERAFIQFIRKGVLGTTNFGLRASDVVRSAFAVNKAVSGHSYIRLRILFQRRTIIYFSITG